MSIKGVKPNKKSSYKQGYFKPVYPEKYIGSIPIIYRSSWERKFMIWCDTNPKIIKWSSESIEIKYFLKKDNSIHRYYPDFWFMSQQEDGSTKKFLVEIKPKSHLQKPEWPKKQTQNAIKSFNFLAEQYLKNIDKYSAAKQYCQQQGWEFIIITEDTLNRNGLH